jgi:hypothetical protein
VVEQVQLTWRLRDRAKLLEALKADPTVNDDGTGPLDAEDENSPEANYFELLDRPELKSATPDLKAEDIPRIVGRVVVGPDAVLLETYDDGRLDRLTERLTALAGPAIPPAHPKTKTLGKLPRVDLALMWEWLLPEGTDQVLGRRLTAEQGAHLLREVWPNTPNPALGGKTPLQAAEAGGAEVPLRAAVVQFEQSRESWRTNVDFAALRERLRIPPEPAVDPATADVAALHLARLAYVPADQLGDEALVALYRRAHAFALEAALIPAAKALAQRPEAMERLGVESISVYMDLASAAAGQYRAEEALDWVRRGRQADAPSKRARNAPAWDIFEVRVRARAERPEAWVPEIAVILDRYRNDPDGSQVVMMNLVDMGLIQMVPSPDRPDEIYLDSRPLQALLAEYGPRITTASGRLGVSASKPEIWTPGGTSTGTGSGGPSKLILPGR